MKTVISLFITALVLLSAGVQEVSAEDTLLVKKCSDFVITGNGSSDEWDKTSWLSITKRTKNQVNYTTKVKVLYSETGMYFLFDCEDSKVTSTIKEDYKDLWFEDVVEVFVWPDEKHSLYFEYELSPLNFELPIIQPMVNGKNYGWLPWHYEGDRKIIHSTSATGGKMVSGGTITGWKAEFFIPYKLLEPISNVPPVSGSTWRANFYRMDYDSVRTSYSWQQTFKTFHDIKNFGRLIFE